MLSIVSAKMMKIQIPTVEVALDHVIMAVIRDLEVEASDLAVEVASDPAVVAVVSEVIETTPDETEADNSDRAMMGTLVVNDFSSETYLNLCFVACYNCQQTGHMSRECPEPRKDNRSGGGRGGFNSGGSRGGFNSGGGGFGSSNNEANGFTSGSTRTFGSRSDGNQEGGNDGGKPSGAGWRGPAGDSSGGRSTTTNSSSMGKTRLVSKMITHTLHCRQSGWISFRKSW
jgi:hypothetical protein